MKSKQTNKQQVEPAFGLGANEKSHDAGDEQYEMTILGVEAGVISIMGLPKTSMK